MSNKGSTTTPSKFSRIMKAPLRALIRARDFYVNSMSGCVGRVQYGRVMGCPAGVVSGVPRSFSFHPSRSTSEADLGELIRAASQGGTGKLNRNGLEQNKSKDGVVVPRSHSVAAIGRIDEEQSCEFEDDVKVGSDALFPRSRSCAVVPKRRVGVLA